MLIGKDTRQSWHLDSVSVDRVSPKKGYVVGNMKLCCRWVNSAKGQSTIRALLYRAEALLHYSARRRGDLVREWLSDAFVTGMGAVVLLTISVAFIATIIMVAKLVIYGPYGKEKS